MIFHPATQPIFSSLRLPKARPPAASARLGRRSMACSAKVAPSRSQPRIKSRAKRKKHAARCRDSSTRWTSLVFRVYLQLLLQNPAAFPGSRAADAHHFRHPALEPRTCNERQAPATGNYLQCGSGRDLFEATCPSYHGTCLLECLELRLHATLDRNQPLEASPWHLAPARVRLISRKTA